MPTPRSWLPRSVEITEILRESGVEELDRGAIEKLFEIQRRAALVLMDQVGPIKHMTGHTVLRTSLLSWVERIVATEGQEFERRQHLSARIAEQIAERRALRQALNAAGKPAVSFTLPQEVLSATVASLPREIEISPGQIVVNFDPSNPEEACQLLYLLGLALANDFDSFAFRQHADLRGRFHASQQAC